MNQLTAAHRQTQIRLGATIVAQLGSAWPLLDPEDLDGTFDRWLTVVKPIVAAGRAMSTTLAGAYMQALRRQAQLGSFPPVPAGPIDDAAFTTSMLVTGPVSIKAATARMVPVAKANDVAQARSSAAGMRMSLDAGRETIVATVKADPHARGWQRIVSGNACQFCQMLGDRGAVYGENSADFQAHDGCSCTAEPVYT